MADIFDRILLLKNSTIFAQVETENLFMVAQALEDEVYIKGDIIFEIGERGDRMFILESGRIGIAIESTNDKFIAELGTGECFGEMNLLDDLPRSATACVIEDCKILSLRKEKLRSLIIKYPELSFGILRSLSIRLRKTTNLLNND